MNRRTLLWLAAAVAPPLLFWVLYSDPALYYSERPVLATTGIFNSYIAAHRWQGLAYLLTLEAVVLVIAWRKELSTRYFQIGWTALLTASAALVILYAFRRSFDTDELEHLHTAWNMLQGKAPLVDFFQHHHPLIWYQNMAPLLVWGDSFASLQGGRGLNLFFFGGILYATYRLSLELTGSKPVSSLAVLLLLTFKYFADAGIENRPDTPQTFFFLWSFYLLLRRWNKPSPKFLVASGFLLALAFLYLQKAVLLFPAFGIVLLFFLFQKKQRFRGLCLFAAAFLTPVLLFLAIYIWNGQIREYLLFNWVINLYKQEAAYFWRYFLHSLLFNPIFLLLLVWAFGVWLKNPGRLHLRLKLALFAGLCTGLLACLSPQPWKQYFLPVWPLLAIGVAFSLERLLGAHPYRRLAFGVLLFGLGAPVFFLELALLPNSREREALAFTQAHTAPGDVVFDENIRYKVFRADLHFFWFSTYRNGNYDNYLHILRKPEYAWLIARRHDDFDFCRLLDEKKPRMVVVREDSDNYPGRCGGAAAVYEPVAELSGIFLLME